jgi:hypothetical protein
VGCNTHVHGSNARNLPVYLSLSKTSKNTMSYVFSSTKSEKRAEQVLSCGLGEVAQTMYTYVSK